MLDQHKNKISVVEKFRDGQLIGLMSTESLGLVKFLYYLVNHPYTYFYYGHDLHSVTRLIQYGAPDNLNTLTQCFWQAARSPEVNAISILLIPKDYFEGNHCQREEKVRKLVESRK